MNEGVRFSASPKRAGPKEGVVPVEVKAMARQFGIPISELAQADDLWQKLTALHHSDPKGYGELVKESTKQVQAPGAEMSHEAERIVEKMLPERSLTPTPGFVVKCGAHSGKAMINCCAHDAVQPPLDPSGREVDVDIAESSARGLHIPMVVGKTRPCVVAGRAGHTAEGTAVDVIFNPWVIARSAADRDFKREVTLLALHWVDKQTELNLDIRTHKHINSRYKGGTGTTGDTPVPCPIEEQLEKASKKKPTQKSSSLGGLTATPESLLQRMRDVADSEADDNGEIRLPQKPLVEEMSRSPKVVEIADGGFDISSSNETKKPAVKKGFLRDTKARLYPKGSDQGQGEGTYSRFMGKCQVIDTSTMQAPKPEEAAKESVPKATGFKKGFLERDPVFDKLVEEADPELGAAAAHARRAQGDPDIDETLDQLQAYADKLHVLDPTYGNFAAMPTAKQTAKPEQTTPASPSPPVNSTQEEPEGAFQFKAGFFDRKDGKTQDDSKQYELKTLPVDEAGRRRLQLVVRLDDPQAAADVELDVAAHSVKVRHPASNLKLKVALPSDFVADPSQAAARFSKKHGHLAVTLVGHH